MNKHSASIAGQVFTRNSKGRVYSHLVLETRSVAQDRAWLIEGIRSARKMNLRYHQHHVDGTSEFLVRPSYLSDADHKAECEKRIARSQAWLALGEDGEIAEALAKFDAKDRSAYLLDDGDGYYVEADWCGRADLAAKLAARTKRAVILPAVLVVTGKVAK